MEIAYTCGVHVSSKYDSDHYTNIQAWTTIDPISTEQPWLGQQPPEAGPPN